MTYLEHLVKDFPIRRSMVQKETFRKWMLAEAQRLGYSAKVECSAGKHDNIVIGNPEKAEVTFTAHYDTPAVNFLPNIMIPRNIPLFFCYQFLIVGIMLVAALLVGIIANVFIHDVRMSYVIGWLFYMGLLMLMLYGPSNKHNVNDNTSGVATILETIAKIPAEQRDKIAFILFDNEEKGLRGSKAYAKEHMEVQYTHLIVNLDCVGVGENILFIAPKLATNLPAYPLLEEAFRDRQGRRALFFPKAGSVCNSDQKSFKCGVAVVACKKRPVVGYYCGKIHTAGDTQADQENIGFLADGLSAFAARISADKDAQDTAPETV